MLTARPPITRVAILHEGVTYSLERPARHHDVISHIVRETGCSHVASGDAQGFIHPPTGKFMRRIAAAQYARRAGQIKDLKWPPLLYSEDLW